jgi:type I restriction enzyme S subunit
MFSNVDKKTNIKELPVLLCNYMDVYYNDYITEDLNFMQATAKITEIEKFSLKKGDVIITKDSETPDDIGVPAFVSENLKNVLCGYHLALIRPNRKILIGEYLSKLFQLQIYRYYFFTLANGVTRFGLTTPATLQSLIPLPSPEEQSKIATILSTWDRAIELTEKLIQAESSRKKGLMQQLLTGKKRFGVFVKSKDYFETKLGVIPKDWKVKKANQIFKNYSQKNNKNEQLLSATQENGVIPRDMIEGRVTMPHGSTNAFKLVDIGDFVISLRSFQGGLEFSNYRGIVSPAYTVLKPKIEIDKKFYKYYFKSRDFISRLAVAVIGIRDGKQISYNDFSVMNLPYPPIPEQIKIATVLTACDQKITLLSKKLEALKTQKKGLMQKLLTGAVRVKT